ncbi:MAG: glutamine amidotransferase [Limnochordaceae bacterium]|nr:glutamine amidotransferase [Limnochordaceae bacterium]
MRSLQVVQLAPERLGLYGDRGNAIALTVRAQRLGILCERHSAEHIDGQMLAQADILLIGGGADEAQRGIAQEFRQYRRELAAAIDDGLVVLAICGGYQLLGLYYRTAGGDELPGAGVLNIWTQAGTPRLVGNIVTYARLEFSNFPAPVVPTETALRGQNRVRLRGLPGEASEQFTGSCSSLGEREVELVGYENHSGRTYLGEGVRPLGRVVWGFGNNGRDRTEGAVWRHVVGTYLHGPVLPKNPVLADQLILWALERRGESFPGLRGDLPAMDWENLAHQDAVQLARREASVLGRIGRRLSWLS